MARQRVIIETERDLISALGGVQFVADKLGIGKTAVSAWQVDTTPDHQGGIPYRHHQTLLQMAKERRLGVTLALLIKMREAREAQFRASRPQRERRGRNNNPIEERAA